MPECMCLLQALQALATSEGCREEEQDLQLAAMEVGPPPSPLATASMLSQMTAPQ